MPKIKITQLPKYKLGDPTCPPGQVYDEEQGKCVDGYWDPITHSAIKSGELSDNSYWEAKEEADKIMGNPFFKDFSKAVAERNRKQSMGMSLNPWKTTGNEGTASNPMDQSRVKPEVSPKKKKKGFFGDMTKEQKGAWIGDTTRLLGIAGNIWATDKANRERKRAYDKQFRFAQFNPATQGMDKGNWTVDAQRTFQPNMQAPVNEGMLNTQYGGDVSLPNVYPNQMVPKFDEGGLVSCPPGEVWNKRLKRCVDAKERSFLETVSQFIPGYEQYLDYKDIIKGAITGNKEMRNRGIYGAAAPVSGKALSGFLDYFTEKTQGKEQADYNAGKRQDIINEGPAFNKALFLKYGWGGYDKWVADGKPPLKPVYKNGGGVPGTDASKVRIKIVDGPQPFSMKYGGQFEGSYGFDVGWRNLYTDMAKTSSDHYTNTMSEEKNPDEDYVLEAEGGEVLYKPGDNTTHVITGPDHSRGGVKLTDSQVSSEKVPDVSSFIFSKTKSMAIKDPEILARFGITNASKGGVVPAKIAKKFELNKYKAIIEDPNKDDLAKRTAAMMLDTNQKYLAELAVVHEAMKGKDAPEFAKTILGEEGGGGEPTAKYGGWISKIGNLRKFVRGGDPEKDPEKKDPEDIDPYTKGQTTPTGKSNVYTKGPEYLQKWETKIPGISRMSNKTAQKAIYKYMLENHPEKIRAMWKEFGLTSKGKKSRSLRALANPDFTFDDAKLSSPDVLKKLEEAYADGHFGGRQMELPDDNTTTVGSTTTTTTLQPPDIKIPPKDIPEDEPEGDKFICVVDREKGYKIVKATMGYDSEEEARANCGKTAKTPPFDYTTPDKVAMAATALVFPRKDYPTIANRQFERGRYALNDWAAAADRAFNTQFLAPSRAAAAYTAPQGLMSNMLAGAGQAADTIVGNVIPTVTSQNVGIFNQFSTNEQQRKDAIDDYNAKAQIARDEGRGRTEQMYQKELADYAQTNAEQFAKAWINRYKWYDQGFVNPNFYKDPRSGRTIFRNAGGFMGASDTDGSDVGSLGSSWNSYYQKFYDQITNEPDDKERRIKARQMADKAVGAGRVSTSYRDPYDFYNARTTNTSYNLPDETEEDDDQTIP